MPIYDENMLYKYIQKAEMNAITLNEMVFREGIISKSPSTEKKESKEESKEQEKEAEDEPQGIGSLFG